MLLQLADAQTKLAESSAQMACLTEELQTLTREKGSVIQKKFSLVLVFYLHTYTLYMCDLAEALSDKATTEHAQFEQSNRVAMETLQQQRDELQGHVQQCLQENQHLTK